MEELISIIIQFLIVIVSIVYTVFTFRQYKHTKKLYDTSKRLYTYDLNKDSYIIKKYCEVKYNEIFKKVYD